MSDLVIWSGIGLCLLQSGLFSGLNLALLGLSRLQLEVEAKDGSLAAQKILALRHDSHFLLTTVLWGNVSVNCLLTLLSDSVMIGAAAFLFSTVGITIVGEILPQAYFSRNAMRVGSRLVPFIRLYQKILYPVAKPTALMLDRWLGTEEVSFFRERELREVIHRHMLADGADLEPREGLGVLNFLVMDDLPISHEGEAIDPESVLALPVAVDLPIFPQILPDPQDPMLRRIVASGQKWVIVTDTEGEPRLALEADGLARDALLGLSPLDPYRHCHRPVVVRDPDTPLGSVVRKLSVEPESKEDDVIDRDVILLWPDADADAGEASPLRRIITGSDLLGRLMRGIVARNQASKPGQARIALLDGEVSE